MDIELPDDLIDMQKVCKHLQAYRNGYEKQAFDLQFIQGAFYANETIIERTVTDCWKSHIRTPQHVISCCFNLAGLQDQDESRRNEKPRWRECLENITKRSAMAYTGEGEEKTAASYALNILDALKKEDGDFAFNLQTCVEQAWTRAKAAYKTS